MDGWMDRWMETGPLNNELSGAGNVMGEEEEEPERFG
jgi:hypothetical protein